MAAARERAERDHEGPERSCIVTRVVKAPDEMIRFVADPDGNVVPDLKRRLPGRGVWVTATAESVTEAVRRKAFARGLKTQVTVPTNLVETIDRLLEKDAVQALSFANKAGEAVHGFTKVERAIAGGQVVALLHAREAADDGVRKLGQALRRHAANPDQLPPAIGIFAGIDLDLALGGAHVIHAALVAGPASAGFLARWRRLDHFRGSRPAGLDGDAEAPQGFGADDRDGIRDETVPDDGVIGDGSPGAASGR